MHQPHILIVEDEVAIADTIVYALGTDGMQTVHCTLGQAALDRLRDARFDLVVLDVGLPDLSGFEVCRRLRTFSDVPVIFLTARHDEIDRIVGLEIGADDYVVKPFSPRELAARVRVILRRFHRAAAPNRYPRPRRHPPRRPRRASRSIPMARACRGSATHWISRATNSGCWRCWSGIPGASIRASS